MKKNIILDLDNTLISAISKSEETKKSKLNLKDIPYVNMYGIYKIYERPELQEFLDFIFKNFNVSVWTAASTYYALFVIKNFIYAKKNRKLDYIFTSYHCKQSKKKNKILKDLSFIVTDKKKLKNYFLIDDDDEVCKAQPKNSFCIKKFDVLDSIEDNELKKMKKTLKKII
jgi:hypothetical protein